MILSKEKIKNSLRWNSLTVAMIAILVFVQTYILLRYLSKEDFGIMAIINAVYFYVRSINKVSVNASIIYIEGIEKDKKKLSTIFWFLLFLNVGLAILILALSDPIGRLYKNVEITYGIRVFSLILLLDFVTAIYKTLLQKQLAFDKLFNVLSISKLISFSIAVYLAVHGFGYKSLLYSVLIFAALEMGICLFYGIRNFYPQRHFDVSELKSILHFGTYETGMRLIGEFRKQIDVVLVGKLLGLEIVGVYSVLKNVLIKLYKFINPLFSTVGTPWMAAEKSDLVIGRKIYFGQSQLLCAILAPIYIALIIFAKSVIQVYFGEDYMDYVLLFQLLSMAYLIGFPISLSGIIITSFGIVRKGFTWSIRGLLLYMTCILILSRYGTTGIAISLLVYFFYMIIALDISIISKALKVSFLSYLKAILPIILVSVFLGLFIEATKTFFHNDWIAMLTYFALVIISFWFYRKNLFEKELLKSIMT